MERVAPAGDVYQAGTLSGNPLATAAGLATLRLLDDGRLRAPRRDHAARSPRASRRPADGPAGERGRDHRARDPVLLESAACATTRAPGRCDLEAYAAFCRAMLERGRLPAAVPVRGLVPVARPHGRRLRAHARGGRRGARGGARVSLLAEVVGGRRPGAGAARRGRSGPGPLRGPRRPGRAAASCSRRCTRATCCTTASRAPSRAWTRTCACWRGDALYALGLSRLARRATWRRWPSWRT